MDPGPSDSRPILKHKAICLLYNLRPCAVIPAQLKPKTPAGYQAPEVVCALQTRLAVDQVNVLAAKQNKRGAAKVETIENGTFKRMQKFLTQQKQIPRNNSAI